VKAGTRDKHRPFTSSWTKKGKRKTQSTRDLYTTPGNTKNQNTYIRTAGGYEQFPTCLCLCTLVSLSVYPMEREATKPEESGRDELACAHDAQHQEAATTADQPARTTAWGGGGGGAAAGGAAKGRLRRTRNRTRRGRMRRGAAADSRRSTARATAAVYSSSSAATIATRIISR
jgi:hypothetical protein